MHDYNTILGVIELRLSKVSYDAVQKRYRIGRSGISLIMNRYNDSGLSLDDLRQMPPAKVVDLIYPKENLRHKDIPLPDFEKIHEQMIQMGKHADLSFLWIDYKKEHPNGYQLAQFYKLYRDFMVDTYGTSKTSMPVERIPGEKMYIDWAGDQPELLLDTATGDLGAPAYRKFDIEAWMPGRGDEGEYGEVTSTSNCTDYQARSLNIRYRDDDGKIKFVHMLNGTAVALSRAMVAVIENYQNEDGSITIPPALVRYTGFDKIEKKN